MSVVVVGTFEIAPEDRDQYVACRADRIRASRLEEGCVEYGYFLDPLDDRRVILTEHWRSSEDFDRHVYLHRELGPIEGDVPTLGQSITFFDAEVRPPTPAR